MCPTQPCSARRFLSETCSIHIVIFSRGLAVLVAQVRMQKEDYGVECKICARTSLGHLVLQRVCATFLRPGLSRSSDGKLARKVDTRPVFKMCPGGGRCRGFRGRPRSCVLDSGRLTGVCLVCPVIWPRSDFSRAKVKAAQRSRMCVSRHLTQVHVDESQEPTALPLVWVLAHTVTS